PGDHHRPGAARRGRGDHVGGGAARPRGLPVLAAGARAARRGRGGQGHGGGCGGGGGGAVGVEGARGAEAPALVQSTLVTLSKAARSVPGMTMSAVTMIFEGGPLDGLEQQSMTGMGLLMMPVVIGGERSYHRYGQADLLDPDAPPRDTQD